MAKTTEIKEQNVSQIVQTIDEAGRDVLGFTVYTGEHSFYNVMRCFSTDDYDQVLQELLEERRQLQENRKQRRKK